MLSIIYLISLLTAKENVRSDGVPHPLGRGDTVTAEKVNATANGNKKRKNIAVSAAVIAVVAVAVFAFASSAPACDTDEQPLGFVGEYFSTGGLLYMVTEEGPNYEVELVTYDWPLFTTNLVIPSSVVHGANTYSVTSVGEAAFMYSNLLTVTIPASVRTIGDEAFLECWSLSSVTILGSIASIGQEAFWDCSDLSSVTVSGSVAYVGVRAFNYCTELTSFSSTSLTTVGPYAFRECRKLASIDLSSTVTISEYAFANCSRLTSADISSVVTIKTGAFQASGLTSVRIPDAITVMENSIFTSCADLASVDLNAVEYVGDGSFQYCLKLQSIVIPNTVETIGSFAFLDSGLTSVTLPDSVKTVKNGAFQNCFSLLSADLNSIDSLGPSAFLSSGIVSIVIPGSVDTLGDMTFYNCAGLTSIALPDGLTTIGRWTFENCTGLTSVTLPAGITSVGMQAFLGCTNLGALAMPYSLLTSGGIGAGAVPAHITRVYYEGTQPVTAYRAVVGGSAENASGISLTLPAAAAAVFLGQSYGSHEIMASGSGTAWQFTKITGVTSYYLSVGHIVTVECGSNGTFAFAVDGDAAWPHFDVAVPDHSIYVPDGSLLALTASPDVKYCAEWEELSIRSFADPSFTVTADHDLILRWLPLWDVTFESNGGSAVATQTVADGDLAVAPAAPTKFGYTFDGWYSDAALTTLFAFTTPITDDTTLYADWAVNPADWATVTFHSNGGSAVASAYVLKGVTVTEPAEPTKTKCGFDGWYSDAALTTLFVFTTPITDDTDLYAKWIQYWDVTFESNGGSAVATQTVADGNLAVEPAGPTKTKCGFDGWYSDAALTTLFVFTTPITDDTTLYAKWIPYWDVTFETNGGSVIATQTVADGGLAVEPLGPTRTKSNFLGWYSDAALTVPFDFSTPITDDTVLYASWYVIPDDDPPAPMPWNVITIVFFALFFLVIFLGGDDDDERKKKK